MFLCALVGPLFPPLPAPCLLFVPFLRVCLSCCFFFLVLCSRSLLLPCALRVRPALLRATLVPLPCAPPLACLPSHSPSRCRPCLYVCPPCQCRAGTRVCHPRALPLPLPLAPTLSPGCSLSPLLPPHPGCLAPCVCGGGCICGLDCGPVPTMRRRSLSNSCRCICIVEPSRLAKGSHSVALRRCPMARSTPSEYGARKLNVFNAAPSCHVESFAAMYQVGG